MTPEKSFSAEYQAIEPVHIDNYVVSAIKNQMKSSGEYPYMLVVDDDPVNLQVIKAMLDTEQYEVKTVLSGQEALYLLRGKFTFNELNQMVAIEKEIQLVQSYLYIEQERFAERLDVHWEVDESLTFTLPALTIHSLVENAIHHGIMKRPEEGSLTIQILQQQSDIEMIVEGDGVGIEQAVLENLLNPSTKPSNGIGLLNTDLRIKCKYGKGLQIKSTKGIGTMISFKIPK